MRLDGETDLAAGGEQEDLRPVAVSGKAQVNLKAMKAPRAFVAWHSTLFDHYRSIQTDNSLHPLPPAVLQWDLWLHALIERPLAHRIYFAGSGDRLWPAVYLVGP